MHDLVTKLLNSGATWIDRTGAEQPVTPENIPIIAPYNAPVFKIEERLPHWARVGTAESPTSSCDISRPGRGRRRPNEFLTFPAGKHDDQGGALSTLAHLMPQMKPKMPLEPGKMPRSRSCLKGTS